MRVNAYNHRTWFVQAEWYTLQPDPSWIHLLVVAIDTVFVKELILLGLRVCRTNTYNHRTWFVFSLCAVFKGGA